MCGAFSQIQLLSQKLYPDIISITSNPTGMSQVGQKNSIVAKVAGRKVEQTVEVTEVVPNKKLVLKQVPGGMMKTYVETTTLEPTSKGTRVTHKVEYEVSAGYLGKALGLLVVNRAVKRNLLVHEKNLKELAELRELPK
jgi:hypothetical protein